MHQGYQLLVWPSVTPRRPFEGKTLGRRDYTVTNVVKSVKHAFQDTLHWKFPEKSIMDHQWIWLASIYKGGDTWTIGLSTSLIGKS